MNTTLKMLYDEHDNISRAIEITKNAKKLIGKNDKEYESIARELIGFFKVYGDQYHHHKEEEILFPEMTKKNELLTDGIIKEMFDNHANFRELIHTIESDIEQKKFNDASLKMDEYTEALLDHIAVENEELFQTADVLFTGDELENIYYRFIDMDNELGKTKKKELTDLLHSLNQKLI